MPRKSNVKPSRRAWLVLLSVALVIGVAALRFRGWQAEAQSDVGQLASSAVLAVPQATFTVNTTDDENTLCNAAACSLREAIEAAAPGDEINFSSLFDAPQVIALQHGELLIEKNLTITGPGADLLTVSGNDLSRIFRVSRNFTVNISGMTLAGGNGAGGNVTGVGGAIVTQGNLTLTRCELNGNTSSRGGAIFNAAGGNLTLVESQVANNTSTNRGGGISSNTTLTVLRSTVIGNSAQGGVTAGGIDASGTLNVINSTISNNQVTNSIGPNAGGIIADGTATIVNSTITQNFVANNSHAGGIHRNSGTVTLRNTIVAGNQPPPPSTQSSANAAETQATLLVGEAGENAPDVVGEFFSAAGGGNNLIGNVGTATGFTNNLNGDRIGGGTSPLLDVLLDSPKKNGGLTLTHALLSGSPAIDAGNDCVVDNSCTPSLSEALTIDQRGAQRSVGGKSDIGAYEFDPTPTPTLSITDVTGPESIASPGDPDKPFSNTFPFEVKLSAPSNKTVTVKALTFFGTAVAGQDFEFTSKTLTFNPGQTSKTFEVFIEDDGVGEAEESFTVELGSAVNATINDGTGLGTIKDDDTPAVSIDDVSDSEARFSIDFIIKLSGSSSLPVSVNIATADGTAKGGPSGDYQERNETVTFAPFQREIQHSIFNDQDTVDEANETFFINLSNPVNATIGDNQAVITIIDDDGPDITAQNVTVDEGNSGSANVNFGVALGNQSPQDITVDFTTADGTAKAGADYTAGNGQVTIPAGQTTISIPVSILGDTEFEPDESFVLKFSNPVNGKLLVTEYEVKIKNDDKEPPTLSITDVTGPESIANPGGIANTPNTFPFEVKLSAPSDKTVTVTATTVLGTALAGSDYDFRSGTLTFNPGQTSKTFVVTIENDLIGEAEEAFTVNLGSAVNATIADGTGLGKIKDDDTPSVSIEDVSAPEFNFDIGIQRSVIHFIIKLSGESSLPVNVRFATANGTATDGQDYTGEAGTITISPGLTLARHTIFINSDTVDEANETFLINLSNAENATIGDNQAVMTIVDDDGPDIKAQNASVNEGSSDSANLKHASNAASTSFNFAVTLANASPQDISVDFTTADGTATAGSDYTATSGKLIVPAGQTTGTINVPILDDKDSEPNEAFFVNFSNPVNGQLANIQATLTIVDDDAPTPAVLQFAQAVHNVGEDFTFATIAVTRSGNTSSAVTVDFATSDGTASERRDYTTALGTLNFGAGETTKSFDVLINEDSFTESVETVNLTLSNATGGASLGAQATATLQISDDATEPPTNAIDDASSFAAQHYRDFLNRQQDPTGHVFWTNEIISCGTDAACLDGKRENVSASFFLSIEFEGTGYKIIRIYKTTFADSPQRPRGLPRYREFVRDAREIGSGVVVGIGDSEQQLAANLLAFARAWVQRPEVLAQLPADMTAAQFVDKLFLNSEVTPAASERIAAITAFGAGGVEGRAGALLSVVANGAVHNKQFNSAFVLMEYFGYLRRNPDDAPDGNFAGFDFWLSKLDSFSLPGEDMRDAGAAFSRLRRAEMVRAFIISAEYRGRFGTP